MTTKGFKPKIEKWGGIWSSDVSFAKTTPLRTSNLLFRIPPKLEAPNGFLESGIFGRAHVTIPADHVKL